MISSRVTLLLVLMLSVSGCSIRKFAINKFADAISSGGSSTIESNDDIELVLEAIPSFLILYEGLLEEVPKHKGLLTQLAQGYTSYTYLGVQQELERAKDSDYELADQLRGRARRRYLKAHGYGVAGLAVDHPGFAKKLEAEPAEAAAVLRKKDLPLIYWTAASLGLAISAARDDAEMIARVPQVEALLDRGLALDETWREGAFHEFAIVLEGAKPGGADYESISRHYQRVVELSKDANAGVHVTYAESVSVPQQQRDKFQELLERAIALDPGEKHKNTRLMNELSHRRARWLLSRIDKLILPDVDEVEKEAR